LESWLIALLWQRALDLPEIPATAGFSIAVS